MPNQENSRDGIPRKDQDRPSPDVERQCGDASGQDYRGDGPAKIGINSDDQPDLVSPSGVNERDHGAADDKPMGGGALNFDDGTATLMVLDSSSSPMILAVVSEAF